VACERGGWLRVDGDIVSRLSRGCRGRRPTSSLRKRYGCFRLPNVPEARAVRVAKRKDVGWLARTDTERKEVEFSEAFDRLTPDGKRYIVLHERAHLRTGPDHDARFYEVLKQLVQIAKVPWRIAYELESYNCHHKS
jgi:hypothetical protein